MLDEKYISEIVESVVSKMDLCDCCNKQKGVFRGKNYELFAKITCKNAVSVL